MVSLFSNSPGRTNSNCLVSPCKMAPIGSFPGARLLMLELVQRCHLGMRRCQMPYPSIYLPNYLCLDLPLTLSIYLSIYLSVCLSVCLSICLCTYLSIYPSVHLLIHVYIYICIYNQHMVYYILCHTDPLRALCSQGAIQTLPPLSGVEQSTYWAFCDLALGCSGGLVNRLSSGSYGACYGLL